MTKRLYVSLLLGLVSVACTTTKTAEKPNNAINKTTTAQQANAEEPVSEPPAKTISKKQALLSSLVGEYPLSSISGAMGANTMIDYVKSNGTWSASGSSIEQGMREGYDIEITAEQQKQLATGKIVVATDLTVAFVYAGEQHFSTPFGEGMTYKLQTPAKDFNFNVPKDLQPTSTFIDGYLYVFAQEKVPELEKANFNVTGLFADAVVLAYHEENKTFELRLFYGECCDTAIYTFK